MSAAPRYPVELQRLVGGYLDDLRFNGEIAGLEGLQRAMSYSLLAPGKRVRPVLALATAQAIGAEAKAVLPLAASLELIHTYSLIHDDLPAMDDDDLRRGRPTCHVQFGEDVAILAGDALYAEAFAHLLAEQKALAGGAEGLLASARELAAATGVDGMVGGQYLDVTGQTADERQLAQVHALKTGRLISASVVCVLHLDGTEPAALARWREFSEQLGMLFQVVDDILDVTATPEQTGKPQGSDARLGKRTYVTERGLDGARELAASLHVQARATLSSCASTGAPALEAITDYLAQRTS